MSYSESHDVGIPFRSLSGGSDYRSHDDEAAHGSMRRGLTWALAIDVSFWALLAALVYLA